VAVTPEDEIVGALLAFPPPNVIEQYVNGLPLASDQEKTQTIAGGIMILAKLRALAVDPDWQGRGIGVGLLDRFKDIYLACHYLYLYPVPYRQRPRRLLPRSRFQRPAAGLPAGPLGHLRHRRRGPP
jgi:GNAT superfamily N-acetyltransferase